MKTDGWFVHNSACNIYGNYVQKLKKCFCRRSLKRDESKVRFTSEIKRGSYINCETSGYL